MTLIQLFYLTSPLKAEKRKYKDSEEDIAIEIGYSLVTLLVCIALICGVYKVSNAVVFTLTLLISLIFQNNRRFILPWLVLKCLECIIWTVITVIIFILFFFMEAKLILIFQFFIIFFVTSKKVALLFGFTFIDNNYDIFCFLALCWYFWLCVWSLYNEMIEDFGTEIPMSQTVPMKDPISQKENQQYSIEFV